MGQFLTSLGNNSVYNILLNFENATPQSPQETSIFNNVATILDKGPDILDAFNSYSGCTERIRTAISHPTSTNEQASFDAVSGVVSSLENYYIYSQKLQNCTRSLISALTKVNPKQSLQDQQALAKQLADLIDFVFQFDEIKMSKSQLQNDIAFYRRMRARQIKEDPTAPKPKGLISDDVINNMAFFFANSTPMLASVAQECKSQTRSTRGNQGENFIFRLFSSMANICFFMAKNSEIPVDDQLFCCRAMVGALIIYDHVDPSGAFHKKSPIKIKGIVTLLKDLGETKPDLRQSILSLSNAIKFSTTTLNKTGTPTSLKTLINTLP